MSKNERSKYNVNLKNTEKRTCDGIVFDSVQEMKYYRDWLCPKVESGDVVKYELQKKYELQPKYMRNGILVRPIDYVADFVIYYSDGSFQVIDIKGCPDSLALTKRKMFWYVYPDIDYRWITYSKTYGDEDNGCWMEYDILKKKRAEAKKKKKKEAEQKEKENGEEN